LQGVPLEEEFFVSDEWRPSLRSIETLKGMVDGTRFPDEIKDADRFDTNLGEGLLKAAGIERA
jgi:hypothetical protein